MVKVRLHGTPEQISKFIEHMRADNGIELLQVSDLYPDRGQSVYVRAYIEAELKGVKPTE